MIRTQLASRRLLSVRRGVLVGADGWPDDPAGQHVVRARAELVANPGAVISHESAAVSWGLATPGFTPWHDFPVSVTSPGRTSHRSTSRSAVWHSGALARGDVVRDPEGYDVTSLARTAVDLAAGRPLPGALVLLDDAARRDALLVGECDGAVKYTDTASILLEKEREQWLRDLGYRIVRWLAKEIMLRPHEVVERIDRALGE